MGGYEDDQVAKDLVELLREHQEALDITPDPSMRLSYEELMTYHVGFEPFFPDQQSFNSTNYDDLHRNLRVTDIMGPRTRAAYEWGKKMNPDILLSDGHRK